MKKIIASLLLVAGCASTQEAQDRIGSRYIGRNLDEFAIKNGPPIKSHQLNNGDFLHVWQSGVGSVPMPATTSVVSPGLALTNGGGSIQVFCELQFVTTAEGTIKAVTVLQDTAGMWVSSRCAELFP